jgi:squalene-associated FAD-dependent desaturase
VFLTRDGRHSYFRATAWPAPFHLSRALLGAHFLTPTDKLRVLRGLTALLRCDPDDDPPLEPWLRRHGQTDRTLARFWNTILVSALNDSVTHVGRKYARKVFLEGFIRQRDGWVVYLPAVPLERLYGPELHAFFARHCVTVRCQAAVRRLLLDPTVPRLSAIELRDGTQLNADQYILAVPFHRLSDLLPPTLLQHFPAFAAIRHLQPSPITSVHLWFDRPVLPWPHAVVVDGLCQWLFRRPHSPPSPNPDPQLHSRTPQNTPQPHYLQVVISASSQLLSAGHTEIQRQVVHELRQLLPAAATARLLHIRTITEHTATFRPLPGVDRYRPSQDSPLHNLALAGDWTATDWPATMEGAVRSGLAAARVVLQRLGLPSSDLC